MTNLTVQYVDGLIEDLKNPEEAAAYLSASLEEVDQRVFLLALRDVAEAHGFSKLAEETLLNRENLYRMLSEKGNPQLSSLLTLLRSVGLKLSVEVESA